MSEEVELERLVVRLMGDGSDYSSMMEDASEKADKFSGDIEKTNKEVQTSFSVSSNEVANLSQTMSAFDEVNRGTGRSLSMLDGINRGTGRSLSMLGRTVSQTGIAIGVLNPELGTTVASLGMLSSGAGQAIRSLDLMKRAGIGAIGLLANPIAFTAITAIAGGIMLWKKYTDDEKKSLEELEQVMQRISTSTALYGKANKSAGNFAGFTHQGFQGQPGEIPVNLESKFYKPTDEQAISFSEELKGLQTSSATAAQAAYDQARKAEIMLTGTNVKGKERKKWKDAYDKHMEEYAKSMEEVDIYTKALPKAQSAAWDARAHQLDTQIKKVGVTPAMESQMDFWEKNKDKVKTEADKAGYDKGMAKARELDTARMLEMNRKEMEDIQDRTDAIGMNKAAQIAYLAAKQAEHQGFGPEIAASKGQAAANEYLTRTYEDGMKSIQDKSRLIPLIGVAEVKEVAILKALNEGLDADKAAELADGEAKNYLLQKTKEFNLELEKEATEQKNIGREIEAARSPRNEELQSAVAVANAYDQWVLSNNDLSASEKDKQLQMLASTEAQKQMLKHAQEGAAIHEKYLFPDEKMAVEQENMKKLLDEGAISLSDYNKALTDVWLQMHKEYSVDLKLHGAEAMVGGTSAAWIAMQNQQRSLRSLDKDLFGRREVAGNAGGGVAGDPVKAQISTAEYMRQLLGIAQAHWVGAPVEVKVAD